jgi:hypothetical protein
MPDYKAESLNNVECQRSKVKNQNYRSKIKIRVLGILGQLFLDFALSLCIFIFAF